MANMTRRQIMSAASVCAIGLPIAGCSYAMWRPLAEIDQAPTNPPPVTVRLSARITLHMIQTGWVSVKETHRAYSGPKGLRLPAIMTDGDWTEWLPVTAWALEHPEGLFVVDTGETAAILKRDYTACDAVTGLFYRRNLRFSLTAQDEIGPQMKALGLAPERVSKVVMTHLHSDHMGGMGWFKQAQFFVSQQAQGGHAGALMCRIPEGIDIRAVRLAETARGVFNASSPLTTDGTVSIIPTNGHANGHQSVLIEGEGRSWLIAGDAAFSLDQIENGTIAGIVEDHAAAVETSNRLKAQYQQFGTTILPTHDATNMQRLIG
ncbi:N-acyl homoserine lactonase family protein [Pseudahrensia aquimaris]|uniref:N-acyl homoserine lactonase family protein n=1 Tax=Pseudahrensia aquimaris TaxID=744461 RepID=A0ABW3FEC4_9HYPH